MNIFTSRFLILLARKACWHSVQHAKPSTAVQGTARWRELVALVAVAEGMDSQQIEHVCVSGSSGDMFGNAFASTAFETEVVSI